jgi:hypothetical protein
MIDKDIKWTDFSIFNLWEGDLPCRHEEAAFCLVSLSQHTGVSCVNLVATLYHQ